jgi:hypothetical protein
MKHRKIFISHSGLDNDLVDSFDRSLKAIGAEPFLAERQVATGENVPEKIGSNIRDSNAFVPVLTQNSLGNQWVNQEIGYAYRWREAHAIDSPYLFPIVEETIKSSVKGFLGIPVTEYIALDPAEPADSIYRLLLSLRNYIDRNWQVFDYLTITCPSCRRSFRRNIPSQEGINKAIDLNESLETECKICQRRVTIDPLTLIAKGSSSGYRWE